MKLSIVVIAALCAFVGFGCQLAGTRPSDGTSSTGGAGGNLENSGSGGTVPRTGSGGSATGSAGQSGNNGGRTGQTDGSSCGTQTFGLNKIPPDLLLVFDKSGSMEELPDGSNCRGAACQPMEKWAQMTTAINQVVAGTDATIRWGLKFFPDDDQCAVSDGATVGIAPSNAMPITAAITGQMPSGRTPTQVAITAGSAYLKSLPDTNPKFILLATDGEPNCAPAGNNNASDAAGAVQAVMASAAMGIPVFVVGVGEVTDAEMTLTQMAIAGGEAQAADPRYYPVSSSADLVSALGTIGSMIASCTFGLANPPPDPANVAVNASGMRIPRDPGHLNGWDYGTGQTSIQLYGSWCDDAKAGKLSDVQAIFGCPDVIIP
ncbi:MAG TPA: vWA domain-containing protein [Polyangia bacterium]|jgi:hypothetical protein